MIFNFLKENIKKYFPSFVLVNSDTFDINDLFRAHNDQRKFYDMAELELNAEVSYIFKYGFILFLNVVLLRCIDV